MKFLAPPLLWGLLLVPALVAAYLLLQRRRRAYVVRFTNLELLGAVAPRRPGWRRHVAPGLFLMAFAVLLVGLARPVMSVQVPREQASVVLVVDVSRSMSATDISPDRMTAAKTAALDFLRTVPPALRVGVVAFSDTANIVAPLSRDRGLARRAVERLEPVAGTAMGDGLAVALAEVQREREGGAELPATVLLLSDGQSNRGQPPAEVAEDAREMKVPVFTVGIGTRGATLNVFGRIVPVDLNEEELRAVAEGTGGAYFRSGSAESLREVYRRLGSALGFEREPREVTAAAAGLGALLMLAGGLASLLWFQRVP